MQQPPVIQGNALQPSHEAMPLDDMLIRVNGILEQRQLHPIYQPIVNLAEQAIIGYESLIRGPSNSPLHSPLPLFEAATRVGKLFELESLSRAISLQQFKRLRLPGKIFLNTTPGSLLRTGHRREGFTALHALGISPDNVVIELTEQFPLDDYEVMREATRYYREMGFEIAIDDLGAGYAGLRMWSELRPEYVKIDKHFIQGIQEDPVKQEFVRSISNIAQGLDCKVIAEGIETEEEYRAVCALGIRFGQGYYFARPRTLPETGLPQHLFTYDAAQSNLSRHVHLSETVACLLKQAPTVSPNAPLEGVVELFTATPGLLSIPVLDGRGVPVGLARRYRLMDVYATPYGRSLYARVSVRQFMDGNPVVVEQDMLVEDVSRVLTNNIEVRAEDDFVVTSQGKYLGVGKVMDLLRKITELQIRNARYANPLTLLPGNVPIYEVLDRLLAEGAPFAVAYCDLDNFKPFNDVYGYAKGDQVLQVAARIFSAQVDHHEDFVGHLGGDDFILIFTSPDWKRRCRGMLAAFESEIPAFYSDQDRANGGIRAMDRAGNATFYPILSLSIGVVLPDPGRCHSHNEVAALASEAKRQAKRDVGNSLFIDRRRGPSCPPPDAPGG